MCIDGGKFWQPPADRHRNPSDLWISIWPDQIDQSIILANLPESYIPSVMRGIILGMMDIVLDQYSDLRDAVSFVLLLVILLVRPNGLLGRSSVKRA